MEIYNNLSPSFGCIKIKNGGLNLIKKEGTSKLFEAAKDACKNYKWHLYLNKDSYEFVNPVNSQTYCGPYKVKRHFIKNKLLINMKNINHRTVTFGINCRNNTEISELYLDLKKRTGFSKMLKILNLLEGKN